MKKINILFTIWGTTYGGAERFVLNLIKNLDRDKYNIVVFSDNRKPGAMQQDFEKNGAKIIYAKYHRYKHPIKHKEQLERIIQTENINIIHANNDLNMIFPLLAKSKKTRFIAHSHNTKFIFTSNRLISAIIAKPIRHAISKRADVRLACGITAGKAMFGKKEFQVILNGAETDNFKFSNIKREKMRKEFKIKNTDTVILNIGRLNSEKNQSFLIDVFSEYNKINPASSLIIIGDGAEKKNLEDKITKLNLSSCVTLLPSQKNTIDFYNLADTFVLTSFFEGMPVVSIEAQINGLPCFFSDAITREADHSGITKFLPLGIGAKEWAKEISKSNLERTPCKYDKIKEYDIKTISRRIDHIYSGLVQTERAE